MKILAIADAVSPVVYSENFPKNLPPFDLVVSAGDMPGHVLEFLATKLTVQPVYVFGNHCNGYLQDAGTGEKRQPGGCINAHNRVVEVGGVLIAGFEGSARYRPGPHQYTEWEMEWLTRRLTPQLMWNKLKYGRGVDILLTHAPPKGPHEGSDYPHRGFAAFNRFVDKWQPRLHVHGHVHLSGANAPREYVTESGVRVVNAFEFTLIELDAPTSVANMTAPHPVNVLD
jgi:Icc-related predicted phosphoesterase